MLYEEIFERYLTLPFTWSFLHRDIKTANILVNNEGILKIGDFGLAKFHSPDCREPLTYRPPELLLGCTNYGTYVDLWSVGCVFAEHCFGRPILKAELRWNN
ncbi:putative protein-serine/threonine kinase CMGC-CDK-CRK7-CDK9 family [Helianthus annuus]|uniref:Protein kinase domain-containing protein n=1 Tax=Helianthus annuus TaxID=4232 RepID=A0A9K3N6Q6_HELAN|nr:putative protein-serine/threonine kinase CMGC-CDK-CRK7-CDK9 family [Helianthus annuus]KAJ0540719.1 putative protein-serine/threonine kinase CMGC-CDK-CRK7-CDK9 family [Helianthus annuus]KAJ0886170.1 putative protein-serine/threonine kinase CMGC-CDK-CRK7-CDK9 family [Helianthus annuus]